MKQFAPSSAARRSIDAIDAATRRVIEPLEARRMLATIEGTVWADGDSNQLYDFFEDPIAGLTVFLDDNRNQRLDPGETTTVTDDEGNYSFTDLPAGTYYVFHELMLEGSDLDLAQTSPGVSGRVNIDIEGDFDIDIVYATNNLSDRQKASIETAIGVWERAIASDLPEQSGIDDLQIVVTGASVDGPSGILAFARPTETRFGPDGETTAVRGEITVDLPDSTPSRGFVETVAHEIGHVMGIGSLWDRFLVSSGTPSVGYSGEAALREYETLFGSARSTLPVEPSVEGHWDESFFRTELMTPFSEGGFGLPEDAEPLAPLSRMTLGALEDLGYPINYAASEPYGPLGIGALPEDLERLGISRVPFEIGLTLTDEEIVDDANFGVRFNSAPNPFFFNAGPFVVAPGQDVRLLAEIDTSEDVNFDGDADFRDDIRQINFWRESNDTPGLQTPNDVRRGNAASADTLLAEDALPGDGYDFRFDTTGLADGTYTFYAQAFDRGYFTTVRSDTIDVVSGQTEVPNRPGSLTVTPINQSQFLIQFNDNSEDESGFLLQVSSEEGFDVPSAQRDVFLPPQEGTGVYTYVYTLPEAIPGVEDAPNSTRFFRVRAFNTVGSTAFAGRPQARTLGVDELLIDNADAERVSVAGLSVETARNNATALTYLRGSGSATYSPFFAEDAEGDYFVFANVPDVAGVGGTLIEVFNEDGGLLGQRTLSDGDAGTSVLVGTFDLENGSFIRFSGTEEDDAVADSVRLLRSGD